MAKTVTVNGKAYNDDPYNAVSNPYGLAAGGHRQNSNFIQMLLDVLADASASLQDTSTTANDIGTGNKTFTLANGRPIPDGGIYAFAIDQDDSSKWMWGEVTDNTTNVITLNVSVTNGTGTGLTNWLIQPTGPQGAAGADGDDWLNAAVENAYVDSPITGANKDFLAIDTSTAPGTDPVIVNLPATGKLFIDFKGGDWSNNPVRLNPPTGETIMDGTADEDYDLNQNNAGFLVYRLASGNWRVRRLS